MHNDDQTPLVCNHIVRNSAKTFVESFGHVQTCECQGGDILSILDSLARACFHTFRLFIIPYAWPMGVLSSKEKKQIYIYTNELLSLST